MREDRVTQRTVTAVMAVIAALAFVFSFGNVWALAVRLGVPREACWRLLDPEVERVCEEALEKLRAAGVRVVWVSVSVRGPGAAGRPAGVGGRRFRGAPDARVGGRPTGARPGRSRRG